MDELKPYPVAQLSWINELFPVQKYETNNCFSCLYSHSFRCRNEKTCPDGFAYIKWTGEKVRQCLFATTTIYQDGYIHCPIIDYMTCEFCMDKLEKEGRTQAYDPSQNYDVEGE